MVTSVLLNVAWMCARPRGTDLRSRRRCRPAGRLGAFSAMLTGSSCSALYAYSAAARLLLRCLLLASHGLLGTALGAGVGAGALSMDGQVAAVALAAVAADFDQPLDVHVHFTPQVPLNLDVAVDELTQSAHL